MTDARLIGSCLNLASSTRSRNLAACTCSLSTGGNLPLLAGNICMIIVLIEIDREVSAHAKVALISRSCAGDWPGK